MGVVWMYIDKFKGEVKIDEDHPLAVAQRARDAGDEPAPATPAGVYRVERTDNGWWKVYGPDGEQVGPSTRSEDEARAIAAEAGA